MVHFLYMKKYLLITSALCLTLLGAGCSKEAAKPAATVIPPDPTNGHLIKGTSYTTVYFLGADGKRYVFPNDQTYLSWFKSYSYVKQLSDEELMKAPLGGNVTYRPGSRLLKITTAPSVYAVAKGGMLRQIETEQLAEQLYGKDWRSKVDDLPDQFFGNYKQGDPIRTSNDHSPQDLEKDVVSIDQDKGLVAM